MKGVVELSDARIMLRLPSLRIETSHIAIRQSTQNYIGAANIWPAANVIFA